LIVDESGKRKVIEKVGEVFPNICVSVLSQAFIVETIHLSDLSRFVVTSKDGDSVPVTNFESYEESDGFDRVVPSINVISHEQVVGIWRISSNAEQFGEIVLSIHSEEVSGSFAKKEETQTNLNSRIDRGYHRRQLPDTSRVVHLTLP